METKASAHDEVLHSFSMYPKVRFETQGPNEEVILLLRAHPVTQIPWIFNTIVLLIILIAGTIVLPNFYPPTYIGVIFIFGLVFIGSYAWFNFLNWYFNVGIISSERILDVDVSTVIYKEVSATRLTKVEDVTSKSAGYFGSLFDYGDLFIQTAGNEVNIEFHAIPMPERVVKVINELVPV